MNFKSKATPFAMICLGISTGLILSGCEHPYSISTKALPTPPPVDSLSPVSTKLQMQDPNQDQVTVASDGTKTTRHADGSLDVVRPDGSTYHQNPIGTRFETKPDGTRITTDRDGTVTTEFPDHTVQIKKPDGSTETRTPDGKVVVVQKDGTVVTYFADGTVETKNPDGSLITKKADGSVTTRYPDGRVTVKTKDGITLTQNPDGSTITEQPDGSRVTRLKDGSRLASESFSATSKQIKKIDFLFVIDNSPSMADNQRRLAEGFRAFANTFYRRADLDICTQIITSDRYLGRTGMIGRKMYARERSLPCTKPAGSENWSESEMQAHIDQVIREFEKKAQVGVKGSGTELLGKSVVSFLYGAESFDEPASGQAKSKFFRKDAAANISFVTDENNYFFEGPSVEESDNDLPADIEALIPGSKTAQRDHRQGIKQYLDSYFLDLTGKEPNYSTTSLLETDSPKDVLPGISDNLDQLVKAVGRESTESDISGPAQGFTDVYHKLGQALVLRATQYTLAHANVKNLQVKLRHLDGSLTALTADLDFELAGERMLTLNPRVLPKLKNGDILDVAYSFN